MGLREPPRRVGRLLGDRRRLTGERVLPDGQPPGAQQPDVGRYEVAGAEPDDVAGHQVGDRDLAGARLVGAVGAAQYGRGAGDQAAQRGQGAVGAAFPGGAQRAAHGDQGEDHGGGAPGGDERGHQPEGEQYGGERVAQGPYGAARPGRRGRCGGRGVLPVLGQPGGGLGVGQSAWAGLQAPQEPQRGVRHFGHSPRRRRAGAAGAVCSVSRPTRRWTTSTSAACSPASTK